MSSRSSCSMSSWIDAMGIHSAAAAVLLPLGFRARAVRGRSQSRPGLAAGIEERIQIWRMGTG